MKLKNRKIYKAILFFITVFTIPFASYCAKNPLSIQQMLDSSSKYYYESNFPVSIEWAEKALAKSKLSKNENNLMHAYLSLGKSLYYEPNYVAAIKNYFSALKIADKLKNTKIQSECYTCIANVYYAQNDNKKAAEYYHKSINSDSEKGISSEKATNMSYLAGIFYNQQQYDSSKLYYERILKYYELVNDSSNLILTQQNLANIYNRLGNPKKALELLETALEISYKTKVRSEIGYAHFSLGVFYAENGNDKKAIVEFNEALEHFKFLNDYTYMSNCNFGLSESYYNLKMYKESMDNYVSYQTFIDSTQNIDLTKEIARKEVSFQMEKKQLADSLKRTVIEKENQIRNDEKMKRQAIYKYIGVGGFMVMLIIVIILLRSNRAKQIANLKISQQKAEVELQKLMIEEKQKEIIDSINYARRIQIALLPSNKYIEKHLKEKNK